MFDLTNTVQDMAIDDTSSEAEAEADDDVTPRKSNTSDISPGTTFATFSFGASRADCDHSHSASYYLTFRTTESRLHIRDMSSYTVSRNTYRGEGPVRVPRCRTYRRISESALSPTPSRPDISPSIHSLSLFHRPKTLSRSEIIFFFSSFTTCDSPFLHPIDHSHPSSF